MTGMLMDLGSQPNLAEFLLARIDEDEQVARTAAEGTAGRWYAGSAGIKLRGSAFFLVQDDEIHPRYAQHIAYWDPERMLAECAAKSAIVEVHRAPHVLFGGTISWAWELRALAVVYASHPDYDPAWALTA